MPANDLLDTIFSLVDKRMDTTESISLELINLMEPEEKRNELRDAWDEFRFDVCPSPFPYENLRIKNPD